MHFICVGQSTLDYNWRVPAIPAAGHKVLADEFSTAGGGMAATAAVAIARLGSRVAFWGRAGNDTAGNLMRAELESYGVDTHHFQLFERGKSPVAAVLTDNHGERQISTFRGGELPADPTWLPLPMIDDACAVLADMRWPEATAFVFAYAKEKGVPTILDGDLAPREDFPKVLRYCDYAIFSTSGLTSFTSDTESHDALQAAYGYGCKVAAVTRGDQGTLWLDERGIHNTPAFRVNVIDTTGAGDVFHGAFTYCVGQKNTCGEAMRVASAMAAIKCTHPAGRDGIPNLQQLKVFLDSYDESA